MIVPNKRIYIKFTPAKKKATPFGVAFLFAIGFGRDSNRLNAARMSAAGEGWTELHIDSIESLILCYLQSSAYLAIIW